MFENLKKANYKVFALKIKKNTGQFPSSKDWVIKNGYPVSTKKLIKLFDGSYNNFRDYCNEPQLKRTQEISLEWFKSYCVIDENQCWNWNKAKTNGYGQITSNGKSYLAHRLAYELSNKELPDLLLVRHKCDNKSCCNPEHLELGTHSDNSNDVVIRKSDYQPKNNANLGYKVAGLSLPEKINFYLLHTIKNDNNCYISSVLKAHHTGYFYIRFENKIYTLHRLILSNKLTKNYKDIEIARHVCNNKSCINPEHLIEGTRKDNALDSRATNKTSKLDVEKVREIRNSKLPNKEIDSTYSKLYGVTKGTISNVRRNKTWEDVNAKSI